MEGQMFRLGTLGFASLLAATATALAQTPAERGHYLVNSILACGNCHTPKAVTGQPIAEKELSGGLVFTTPAFDATASNITRDRETGIGAWSDAEIKRAITEGVRPARGRTAGRRHACEFLQGDAAARSRCGRRVSSLN